MKEFVPYVALLISVASFWLSYRVYLRTGSQSKRASVLELARHLSALEATWGLLESELTFVRDAADQAAHKGRDVKSIQEWIKAVAQMHESARKHVEEMNENLQNNPMAGSQERIDAAIMSIDRTNKKLTEIAAIVRRKYEPLLELIDKMPPTRNG